MRVDERLLTAASWLLMVVLALLVLRDFAPGTALGEGADLAGTLWFFEWTRHALLHLMDPFQSTWTYWPVGEDLFTSAGGNQLDALLAAPLVGLLGLPLWTWAWGFLVLWLNGISAHALARDLGASRPAALASAGVFLLHPYALNELGMGRPTQALLFWTPLALLALLRSRVDPRWRWPVLGGALLAAQAWTWWFMGHFSLLVLGPLLLVLAARERAWWPRLGLAAATALLLVLPGVIPMMLAGSAGEVPGYGGEREGFHDQLASLQSMGWWALAPSLGPVALPWWLPAGLLGCVALVRERLAWGLALALGLLLAAGPVLGFSVGSVGNPIWSLASLLPGWERLFYPYRALSLVAVLGVPLIALGLDRLPRPWRWAGLVAPALFLLRPPLPSTSVEEPVYAAAVREDPGPVLVLPWRCTPDRVHEQAFHGAPILGGQTENLDAYFPDGVQALLDEDPLLGPLAAVSRGKSATPSGSAHPREIHWVVLHLEGGRGCGPLPPGFEATARRWLGEPTVEEPGRLTWRVD